MHDTDTLILVDTCSLLFSCWDSRGHGSGETFTTNRAKEQKFWDMLLPSLGRLGELIVTKRNYDELVKLSAVRNDSRRPQLAERCAHVLKRLLPLVENNFVSIVGDTNDPFADATLLSVALKFRTQKNMLFITQDRALASDLIAISNFKSVRPGRHQMKVRRLDRDGGIEKWQFSDNKPAEKSPSSCVPPASDEHIQAPKEWWR